MKKIISILFMAVIALFISGCACSMNDNKPNEAIETLFEKYRNKDENVLTQLKQTIEGEVLNDDNKVKYQALMERQYDSFSYVIKDVETNDDSATSLVEITVLNYKGALEEAEEELKNHPEKFNDEDGKFSEDKYTKYKIELMEKVEDTTTYTINLNLTKEAGMWKVDELTKDDIKKLHGVY